MPKLGIKKPKSPSSKAIANRPSVGICRHDDVVNAYIERLDAKWESDDDMSPVTKLKHELQSALEAMLTAESLEVKVKNELALKNAKAITNAARKQVAHYDQLLTNTINFDASLNAEIRKRPNTILEFDYDVEELVGEAFMVSSSVEWWARKTHQISLFTDRSIEPQCMSAEDHLNDVDRWTTPRSDDERGMPRWEIAVRHIAQELVREDPVSGAVKKELAPRIQKMLDEHMIYKRGGKVIPALGSIQNALSRLKL